TNKNGEVLFEEFTVGKNKSYFFSAQIIDFGSKGKIQFNLVKVIQSKKNIPKKIEIVGLLTPSNSKVVFKKFLLDGNELSVDRTKEYENEFQDIVIKGSLSNMFNEDNLNRYIKNLF
ncbi:hypothetical protein OAB59_03595, partial [Pelagibacteraceae bacterium]|nr:hypothetical protein [Pelagibacteraceae bacterium]